MEAISTLLAFISGGIATFAGGYATVMLGMAGLAHMRGNQQKVENARDHMGNIGIGLFVAVAAGTITAWFMGAF